MIPWYRTEEVAALDSILIKSGHSGLELMETVGCGIAEKLAGLFPRARAFLICAGAGNNGGDGFVVARRLLERGAAVTLMLSHAQERSKGDAAANLLRLQGTAAKIWQSSQLDEPEILRMMKNADVVVDALLGTGASGEPRGETARLIAAMNRAGRPVLAVDLPSGLEGQGLCVKADFTCTAAARKLPFATGGGAAAAGSVSLIPLADSVETLLPAPQALEVEEDDLLPLLPARRSDDHKGSRGGVLIVAGSKRYRGAPLLAARGALRMGAGLVVVASVEEVLTPLSINLPEAIMEPLEGPDALDALFQRWAPRCSTLLIGSGLDRDGRAEALCSAAARRWPGSSLWDGDGLHWLARNQLKPRKCCVTPHEGEAAALLGDKEILKDRVQTARRLAQLYGTAILKGYRSVVAAGGETPLIVPRGDRTLSVPGSGDVLAGASAALLAAGLEGRGALALAAWCHGAAGEKIGRERGRDGVLAAEVADMLPGALKELRDRAELQERR